jgi:ADP-heptose:LPS heptosyltransferase
LKILIIRFSSIGDIVLTTPIIRCLRKRFPDAEIHFLTKATFHPLLIANPNINKIYLLEGKLKDVIEELQEENYDFIVDLHKNIRSLKVRTALGVKTYTFDKLNLEKWLKVNLKVDVLSGKHLVDRYFDALESLGVKNDGQGLDYYIWEKEIYDFLFQLAETPYTVVVAGANHYTKCLPEDMLIRLCEKIKGKIVLLGGKKEAELGERVNQVLPAKIVNLCGKLSINESAFVVKNARRIVTPDTGLMHIAAAFKKPLVVIWGNTVPEFGMYPYFGERNDMLARNNIKMFEVEGLSCRPCSKLGYEECPREHFKCMREQDLDQIATAVNQEKVVINQ